MLSQQQIIALAVEAGLAEVTDTAESLPADYVDALAKFAALAVAKETEARIKLQKEFMEYQNDMQARGTRLIKEAYQRGVRDEREACLAEIETGIWIDKTTDEVLAAIADAIRARSDVRKISCTHRHSSFSHDGKDICHLCGKEKPSANESADSATIHTSSTTE